MILIYILLTIIAIGVLWLSDLGRRFLSVCCKILVASFVLILGIIIVSTLVYFIFQGIEKIYEWSGVPVESLIIAIGIFVLLLSVTLGYRENKKSLKDKNVLTKQNPWWVKVLIAIPATVALGIVIIGTLILFGYQL